MRLATGAFWFVWNSFLALVPVGLAWAVWLIAQKPPSALRPSSFDSAQDGSGWRSGGLRRRKLAARAGIVVLLLAWLAFLPNTCYLLTEWRHFLRRLDAGDLYLRSQLDNVITLKLMLFTAFCACWSAFGMLMLTLAIRPIAGIARKRGMTLWIWGIPLFLLVSIGVYLGLVLRYNSWYLITQPGKVWAAVADLAYRPVLSGFIAAFAAFLWLAYGAIDIWIDGLIGRWSRGRQRDGQML